MVAGGRRASGHGATGPSAAESRGDSGSQPGPTWRWRRSSNRSTRPGTGRLFTRCGVGPLGRAVSLALFAQATPVARPRCPRPGLGLAAPTTPPSAYISAVGVLFEPPFPPTWPSHPLSPLVHTHAASLSGPDHLRPSSFVSRGGEWVRRQPPAPAHFLSSGLGVRSWRPQDDRPLTPSCPFICWTGVGECSVLSFRDGEC